MEFGGGPKRYSSPDLADMLSGLNVKQNQKQKSKSRVSRPPARTSARVAELEMMDMLARMGMEESSRKPATYVPTLPVPKPVDSMANLEKKRAKQLHEMIVQMAKKLQYIKNEEVLGKIRIDIQRAYDAFNARYEAEVQELHTLKQDIEETRTKLVAGGAKLKRRNRI